jgi:hypothetical protein
MPRGGEERASERASLPDYRHDRDLTARRRAVSGAVQLAPLLRNHSRASEPRRLGRQAGPGGSNTISPAVPDRISHWPCGGLHLPREPAQRGCPARRNSTAHPEGRLLLDGRTHASTRHPRWVARTRLCQASLSRPLRGFIRSFLYPGAHGQVSRGGHAA